MEPWLTGFTCANLSTDDLTWRTVSGDDNRWKNRVFRPDAAAIDDTASQAGRQGFESPRPLSILNPFAESCYAYLPTVGSAAWRSSKSSTGTTPGSPQRPHDASQDTAHSQI